MYKQKHPPSKKTQKSNSYCKLGYLCSQFQFKKCPFKHQEILDMEKYTAYKNIKKNKKTIVIMNTASIKQNPMCLFCDILPIKLQGQIKKGVYYEAEYINEVDLEIILKITKQIGGFGNIKVQLQIMQDYVPKIFKISSSDDSKLQSGYIDVNWQYEKVLKSSGRPKYLSYVNEDSDYALFNECKVHFVENKKASNNPKICSIKYEKQNVTGILQIDPRGLFYLIPRNMKMDDLSPFNIPEGLAQHIQQLQRILPYSFLKNYEIDEPLENKINQELKKYLVRGKFYDWPLQSRYPLIELQPQFCPMGYKARKDAIIFQYNVNAQSPGNKEVKESKKICEKFDMKKYQNRFLWKTPVYAFDNKGTQCHDDALSVIKMDNGYEIAIHIADVSQLIKQNDPLDKQIMKRDETVYIKGYYSPLLSRQLIKLFSLRQGSKKIAYTLKFFIENNGLIDFKTIKFEPTIIEVQKNEYHSPNLSDKEELQEFIEVSRVLANSDIFSSAYFVDEETQSEKLVNRLVQLSAMLPTAILKFNEAKLGTYKEKLDEYTTDMLKNIQKKIEEWDKKRKIIKENEKKIKQNRKQQQKIETLIKKELRILRKQFNNEVKEKKVTEKIITINGISDEPVEKEDELLLEEDESQNESKLIADELKQELKAEEQEKKHKEKLEKIKKVSKVEESSSSQSELEEETEADLDEADMVKLKERAAQGGLNYVSKIFNYFKIPMSWKKLRDIEEGFRELNKQKSSPLFKKYVKRMEIMNRQHYKYWLKILEKDKKVEKPEKVQSRSQKEGKRGEERKKEKKLQYRSKQENKKVQENNEFQNKKIQFKEKAEEKSMQNLEEKMTNQDLKFIQKSQPLKVQEAKLQDYSHKETEQKKQVIQSSKKSQEKEKNSKDDGREKKQRKKQGTKVMSRTEKWKKAELEKHQQGLIQLQNIRNLQNEKKQEKANEPNAHDYFMQIIKRNGQFLSQYQVYVKDGHRIFSEEQKKRIEEAPEIRQDYIVQRMKSIDSQWKKHQEESKILFQKINKNCKNINKIKAQVKEIFPEKSMNSAIFTSDRKLIEKSIMEYCILLAKSSSNQEKQEEKPVEKEITDVWKYWIEEKELKKMFPLQMYWYMLAKIDAIIFEFKMKKNEERKNLLEIVKQHVQRNQDYYKEALEVNKISQRQLYLQYYAIGNRLPSILPFKYLQFDNKNQMISQQDLMNLQTIRIAQLYVFSDAPVEDKEKNKKYRKKNKKQSKETKQEIKVEKQKHQEPVKQKQQDENKEKVQKISEEQKKQTEVAQLKDISLPINQSKSSCLQQEEATALEIDNAFKQDNLKPETSENQEESKEENKEEKKEEKKKGKSEAQILIDQKIQKLKTELEIKYQIKELKQSIKEKQAGFKQKIRENETAIKEQLHEIQLQYNFLDWVVSIHKKAQPKSKKKKNKKKGKKEKNEAIQAIQDILDIVDDYYDMTKVKAKLLKEDQLEKVMKQKIEGQQQVVEENIKQQNQKFIDFFKDWSEMNEELQLLKWNNPIRSYAAIKTQRMIKKYEWVFNGNLSPLQVFKNFKQLKELKSELKKIEEFKLSKRDLGQQSKKLKECNRQIEKLEFYYKIKDQKSKTYRFLNVGSPDERKVKYVFHEILEEIQVSNFKFNQIKYEEVDGEVQIQREFPLSLKIKIKP